VVTAAEAVTDTTRKLRTSLDEYNGDGAQTLPAATMFVGGPDRAIRFAAASRNYSWSVGPEEVLAALCASGAMRSGFSAQGPSAHDCSSRSSLAQLSGPLATLRSCAAHGFASRREHHSSPKRWAYPAVV
jgi:hypothetical protein